MEAFSHIDRITKEGISMAHLIADDHANPTQQRTVLLATDLKNSVLAEVVASKANHMAYSAYGHQSRQQEVMTRLGFNGELREMQTSWYLLGNGYRAYNPRLMHFHSPDNLSPFGKGGLNAYMYCGGEPVMNSDPTGHALKTLLMFLGMTADDLTRVGTTIQRTTTNVPIAMTGQTRLLGKTITGAPIGTLQNSRGVQYVNSQSPAVAGTSPAGTSLSTTVGSNTPNGGTIKLSSAPLVQPKKTEMRLVQGGTPTTSSRTTSTNTPSGSHSATYYTPSSSSSSGSISTPPGYAISYSTNGSNQPTNFQSSSTAVRKAK